MPNFADGAPGGTRTPTPLRVPDFESGASTGSATGARAFFMVRSPGRRGQRRPRGRRADVARQEKGTQELGLATTGMAAPTASLGLGRAAGECSRPGGRERLCKDYFAFS